jgi:hypothetical protein
MLTIKGILKLQNVKCQDRQVWIVTENTNESGQPYYSFRFKAIENGKGYNKETEIRLFRDMRKGRGAYEMFVMGLAATTTIWVIPEELKDMESLRYLISKSLGTAKWWWENECSEGYRNQ